jgi:hypothetical protein
MLTYSTIAAGEPSDARAMTNHLLTQTLPRDLAEQTRPLMQGIVAGSAEDRAVHALAGAVWARELGFGDAVSTLMLDHADRAADLEAEEQRLGNRLVRVLERRDFEDTYGPAPAEPRRDLHPLVARGLALDPDRTLSRSAIQALLAGRRADGRLIEGKSYATRRAFTDRRTGLTKEAVPIGSVDFCLTPDKSVSIAWAFAAPAEQAAIYLAHRDAAAEAMAAIEARIGQARRGQGGRDGADPGHVGWIAFDHYTCRPTLWTSHEAGGRTVTESVAIRVAGDPDLHTHFTVMNAVFCDNGRVGSLDLNRLDGLIKEAGALYQAFLASHLRRLGAEVDLDPKTGMARLAVIPDRIREHFSKRSLSGEEAARAYARRLGLDWDALPPARRSGLLKAGVQGLPAGLDAATRAALRRDDMADFAEWRRQADELGWQYPGIEGPHRPGPAPTRAARIARAYEAALPWLEAELNRRAVITAADARTAALRGLIAAGIEEAADVGRVTTAFRAAGVRQYGEPTALVWGHAGERGEIGITTALQAADEGEFLQRARQAATDRSGALTPRQIRAAIAGSGLDFAGAHGASQQQAMLRLGGGGRLGVVIGAAGSGKTSLLKPLVTAWSAQGRVVHGVALAWRQADDLTEAGIERRHVRALSVFLDAARAGALALDRHSVVVVDELGLLGTRQGLALLRLQAERGFRLAMLGDDRQCQAQPLDARVLTPHGWRQMGELKVGDQVICPDGSAAQIVAIQDHGEKEIWRVEFSDGRSMECCLDHLWTIWRAQPVYSRGSHAERKVINKGGGWAVRPLSEIKRWFDNGYSKARSAAVPLITGFADNPSPQSLPIPPYALGLMLGDGHFAAGLVRFTTADRYLIDRLAECLPDYEAVKVAKCDYRLRVRDTSLHVRGRIRSTAAQTTGLLDRVGRRKGVIVEYSGQRKTIKEWAATTRIPQSRIMGRINRLRWPVEEALGYAEREPQISNIHSPLSRALRNLGLEGTRSHSKFVPDIYKSSSAADRLAILRGLMDTDGTVGCGGTYGRYHTVSKQLARDVQELAWSLGAIATIGFREAGPKRPQRLYYVDIRHPHAVDLFELPRKRASARVNQDSLRLRMTAITPSRFAPSRCILVDHPDHLYITDNYIVTHNSIEAGPIVDLVRRALGPAQVPEILTTIRQHSEREREIAGHWREGRAAEALAMKRADGTAEMVPGGYRETVERVAALVEARLRAHAGDPGYSLTVSVPTNADAHRLSLAIRAVRRGLGQVGPDQVRVQAVGRDGQHYDMALAAGDRVRLLASTPTEGGGGTIGRNGSVLTVLAADAGGVLLRNAGGREGRVAWSTLADPAGRIRLAYGEVMTTHTAQGSTATEHIYALPAGTRAVTGFAAYASGTRHRRTSYLLISAGAERAEVVRRRPINDVRPVQEADIWANAAVHLGRQPRQEGALAFLARAGEVRRGAVRSLQHGARAAERREAQGRPPTVLASRLAAARGRGAVQPLLQRLERGLRSATALAARLSQWADRMVTALRTRLAMRRVRLDHPHHRPSLSRQR